jgi:alpha-amylase
LTPELGRALLRPLRCSLAAAATALFLACSGAPAPKSSVQAVAAAKPSRVTVVPQESWRDSVLYFVITDRFADGDPANDQGVDRNAKGAFHGGDLKGLTEHLDEIADLGVTALWITPVVKNIDGFVTGSGMPDWGYHGYWADDFYRLDPRFGTEAELKTLVDEAHARGMKVLLDVVYNHAGYDSNLLKDPQTRGWLRSEALGTCGQDDLTTCVGGLPDFKTELPEVRDYLMKAHLGLAQRVGVDGFRLDTVKNVEPDFWKEHRRRTREQLGASFFLLGEVWGGDAQGLDPYFSADELDAGFDFSFAGNAIGWVTGRGRTVAFDHYLKSREKVRAGHLLSPYLSSHDVPGALFQLKGDKELFRLAALLELTAAGLPMIYYGEEVGRAGGDWPDNRSDMPWGDHRGDPQIMPGAGKPRDEALRADYKKMIAIRRAHPAFSRGVHAGLATDGDLLVFSQRDEASHDAVVVAINRGSAPATASFDAPAEWGATPVRDVWTGGAVSSAGGRIEAVVAPRSARIFAVR